MLLKGTILDFDSTLLFTYSYHNFLIYCYFNNVSHHEFSTKKNITVPDSIEENYYEINVKNYC